MMAGKRMGSRVRGQRAGQAAGGPVTDDSTPPDPPDDSAGAPASEPPDRWRPPGDRPPGGWPPPPVGDPPPEAEWRSEPDSGPLPSRPGSSSGWPGDRYEMPPPGQRVFDSYEAPAGRPGPEPDADRTREAGPWAGAPPPNRGGGAAPGVGPGGPGPRGPPPPGRPPAPARRVRRRPGLPRLPPARRALRRCDLWGS